MTTRVKIENVSDTDGTHDIRIGAYDAKNDWPDIVLSPGKSVEVHVYDGTAFKIEEVGK